MISCLPTENNGPAVGKQITLSSKDHKMPVLWSELSLNKEKRLVFFGDELFTGTAIQRYRNDTLALSIAYVKGIRHGYYRKWFEDGTLSFEAYYQEGKKSGESHSWWRNGNLRSESYFVAGVPQGEQKQYYKSGPIFKLINMVDGKEEGMQKSWRENGKLYNNYEAKNGRIFGLKRSKLCFELNDEKIVYND